jgi:hypothetical protein
MIAPNYHFDHPFREEIESLEYRPWQLDVSEVISKDTEQIARDNAPPGDDGVWIATEDNLIKLLTLKSNASSSSTTIPLDVSTGYDFLIDALTLRYCLPLHLDPILANPNIVKVMHF